MGIPSFNFTIQKDVGVLDGNYNFRVAVTFEDASIPNRRMEAEIGTLTLNVTGGVITGSIPNQNMKVLGRNGAGTLQVDITVPNQNTNGPVTVTGGTVSFNATNLISRIRSSHTLFDTVILAEFNQPATYKYRITVQQTSGPATLQFGTSATSPAFTAFPRVQTPTCGTANCVNNNAAFLLKSNELASGYTDAYTVTGQFNVVTVSSGGGGGGTTTPVNVTQTTTELTNTINSIVITPGTTPSTQVVEQLNTAVTTTNNLMTNLATQLTGSTSTVSTTQALSSLTVAKDDLTKVGNAASAGGNVNTASTTSTIESLASVISALSTRTLSDADKTSVNTIAAETVTAAAKLITADTPRSTILNLVEATADLLKSTLDASGEVREALATQLQQLSNIATQGVLKTLPASLVGANTNLQSVDAIRALTANSASVRQQTLTAGPKIDTSTSNNNQLNVLSPNNTATPTPTPTPTATPTATASASPSPSAAPTASATPTPTPTPTPSPISRAVVTVKVGGLQSQMNQRYAQTTVRVSVFTSSTTGCPDLQSLLQSLLPGSRTVQSLELIKCALIDSNAPVSTSVLQGGLNVQALQGPVEVVPNANDNGIRIKAGGQEYAAVSTATRVAPSTLTDGVSSLPDGRFLLVSNGYSFELASAPVDYGSFASAIAYANYTPNVRTDGGISIELSASERFTGAFAADNIAASGACGFPTFTAPTVAPTDAAYAFRMVCANGATQRITPLTDTPLFYSTLVNAGLETNTDRDTGIVTIASVGRFKPSFFVTVPTAADTTYFNARKNADGVAFRARDANGDGRMDYDVMTATSVQLLYGLP